MDTSLLTKFKSGVGTFQALVDELSAGVEKEREELRVEREKVDADRKQFEDECKRVHNVSDSEQVTLNIGGFKVNDTT